MPHQTIFISSFEFSAEQIALPLMDAIQAKHPEVTFFGIGGDASQGKMELLANNASYSVMGITDAMTHYFQLKRFLEQIVYEIKNRQPAVCLLLDYPGLHLILAEKIKDLGIPVVQVIAPKVWAWGKSRIPKLRDRFDKILGILPFESGFFHSKGVDQYIYCGNPFHQRIHQRVATYQVGAEKIVQQIVFLPGSRPKEIERHFKYFHQVAQRFDYLPIVVSLPRHLENKACTKRYVDRFEDVRFGRFYEDVQASSVALTASGTATLETALLGCPQIVLYRLDPFSYWMAKLLVDLPYVSLVNLCAQQEIVPEYIQRIPVAQVCQDISMLMDPTSPLSQHQKKGYDQLEKVLGPPSFYKRATEEISPFLEKRGAS